MKNGKDTPVAHSVIFISSFEPNEQAIFSAFNDLSSEYPVNPIIPIAIATLTKESKHPIHGPYLEPPPLSVILGELPIIGADKKSLGGALLRFYEKTENGAGKYEMVLYWEEKDAKKIMSIFPNAIRILPGTAKKTWWQFWK